MADAIELGAWAFLKFRCPHRRFGRAPSDDYRRDANAVGNALTAFGTDLGVRDSDERRRMTSAVMPTRLLKAPTASGEDLGRAPSDPRSALARALWQLERSVGLYRSLPLRSRRGQSGYQRSHTHATASRWI